MTALAPPTRVRVPDPGPPTRVRLPAVQTPTRVRLPAVQAPTRVRLPALDTPTRVRLPALDTPTRVRLPLLDTPIHVRPSVVPPPARVPVPGSGPDHRVSLPGPDVPARVRLPRAGRAPVAGRSVPDGADERGDLTVDDRVVEKVAGYAVLQVPGAAAPPTRVLGVNVGEADADGEAKVRARVDGGTAVVEATVAVGWPSSVRSVVERVREAVVREVGEIVDVRVDHVDVDVVSLTVPSTRSRSRRLR